MEPSDAETLYGTTEEPTHPSEVHAAPFDLAIHEGRLRHLRVDGTEIIRGIEVVVRDEQWGTCQLRRRNESSGYDGSDWVYRFDAVAEGEVSGELEVTFDARIHNRELTATATLRSSAGFTTSRSGLVLLHPIAEVVGQTARVVHSDGSHEDGQFPDLISPGQPFFDIAEIQNSPRADLSVHCAFEGDVFEMEDQRNWTDASFKTYNRPLAWPSPYRIGPGEEVVQRVRVSVDGAAGAIEPPRAKEADSVTVRLAPDARRELPALGMGYDIHEYVSPQSEQALAEIRPGHLHMRIDLRRETLAEDVKAAAALVTRVGFAPELQLGVVVPDDADPSDSLRQLAALLEEQGLRPAGVLALPAAYLKSYQPDGQWPATATPDELVEAVREAFPGTPAGGGMLTYFTEVNRCRPSTDIDFLSHSTAAIVHAADDISVMETLEALPDVFRTGRALVSDGIPYRIGMSAIGMWSNPYGVHTFENEEARRIPMARNDPRQRGQYAAAWNVGYYARAAEAGVDAVALSSLGAPFPTGDTRGAYPLFHVLRGLAQADRHAGLATSVSDDTRIVAVAWKRPDDEIEMWLANCGAEVATVQLDGLRVSAYRKLAAADAAAARADTTWMERTEACADTAFSLDGFGVLRVLGTAA